MLEHEEAKQTQSLNVIWDTWNSVWFEALLLVIW